MITLELSSCILEIPNDPYISVYLLYTQSNYDWILSAQLETLQANWSNPNYELARQIEF